MTEATDRTRVDADSWSSGSKSAKQRSEEFFVGVQRRLLGDTPSNEVRIRYSVALAREYLSLRDDATAYRLLKEYTKLVEDDPKAFLLLALIRAEQKNVQEANQYLERAFHSLSKGDHARRVKFHMKVASIWLDKEQLLECWKNIHSAMQIEPKLPLIEVMRCRFLCRASDDLLLRILNDSRLAAVELIVELLNRWARFNQSAGILKTLDDLEGRYSLEKQWWRWQFDWLESTFHLNTDARWLFVGLRRLYALERLTQLQFSVTLAKLPAAAADQAAGIEQLQAKRDKMIKCWLRLKSMTDTIINDINDSPTDDSDEPDAGLKQLIEEFKLRQVLLSVIIHCVLVEYSLVDESQHAGIIEQVNKSINDCLSHVHYDQVKTAKSASLLDRLRLERLREAARVKWSFGRLFDDNQNNSAVVGGSRDELLEILRELDSLQLRQLEGSKFGSREVHEQAIREWYSQQDLPFEPPPHATHSQGNLEFRTSASPKQLEEQFFTQYKTHFGRLGFEPVLQSPTSFH